MDVLTGTLWSPADYCLSTTADAPDDILAATVYDRVCRTDFSAPGFCLVDLGPEAASQLLRRFMVALKHELQRIHQSRVGRDLAFVSMGRFDQQVTTKPHRDGGPDECFLMLGYEPSQVIAEVAMSDYAKCAHDLGITPFELLDKHNPMFGPGAELLRSYTTHVACFSNRTCQVLLINNSVAAYSDDCAAWQGVLHTARILNPSNDLRRVVNSTMVASFPIGEAEPVSIVEQEEFIATNVVHRRGYDKLRLDDDT